MKALRIGVSRGGLTLLGTRGWLRPQTDVLADLRIAADGTAEFAALANHLDGAIRDAQCSRLPTSVVIANDLVRYFMVTPPRNATGLQDCKVAAAMRFHSLYGEPPNAWRLAADWHVEKPFLACALPRMLLDEIRRVTDVHRLTLVEVIPQFVAAWNAWSGSLKPDAWFGVVDDKTLTLGATANGYLISVRTAPVLEGGRHDGAWLAQHVAREALRLSLDTPSRLQLCGDMRGHWATQSAGPLVCEPLGAQDGCAPGIALASTGARW